MIQLSFRSAPPPFFSMTTTRSGDFYIQRCQSNKLIKHQFFNLPIQWNNFVHLTYQICYTCGRVSVLLFYLFFSNFCAMLYFLYQLKKLPTISILLLSPHSSLDFIACLKTLEIQGLVRHHKPNGVTNKRSEVAFNTLTFKEWEF